jgi:hypothetical protein
MKTWNIKTPKKKGGYICRMTNCYIKMCFWDGNKWLDMWKPTLEGDVKEWMNIPYDALWIDENKVAIDKGDVLP